jgi:hypothetical protein
MFAGALVFGPAAALATNATSALVENAIVIAQYLAISAQLYIQNNTG